MSVTSVPPGSGPAGALIAQAKGLVSQAMLMADQPAMRRAFPAVLIAVATAVALFAWVMMQEPARQTLFPGMAEADKAHVIDTLSAAGIAAKIDPATGDVTVPSADYHRARMQLAAQGLPQSAPDGNALISDLPMGASRSVEGARLRQAQEMDLAQSIMEITSIQSARVHLALAEKSAFLRDQQPPSASVILQLAPGRVLDAGQVEAIVNLVSSSVPGMARGDVTVVDQMGRLLSRGADDPTAQTNDRQLQYRMDIEKLYRERIESLLTPITGPDNLSVQVTVDMDFTQSQITEERVDPQGTALKTEQSQLNENATPAAKGVPGAISNTPPSQSQLATQPGAAGTAQGTGGGATSTQGAAQSQNRSETTNKTYEVSRTVQTTQPAVAKIRRVSAAILLRAEPPAPVKDGEVAPPLLPDALKADLEQLAQGAIGYDAARGDVVTITARPFVAPDLGQAGGGDMSWLPDALRQLGLIAAVAIVVLGVVRPLLSRVGAAQPSGEFAAMSNHGPSINLGGPPGVEVGEGETLDDVQSRLDQRRNRLAQAALGATATREEKFAVLRQIVTEDPGRIASMLQKMMKEEVDQAQS